MFRDALFSTLLSLFTCYVLSLLFLNLSFFNPIAKALKDFSFLDVYYAEKLSETKKIDSSIVLINVEHKDRMAIALALEEVLKADPKVVGFDIILKEPKGIKADTILADLLNKENVVLSHTTDNEENIIANYPFFAPLEHSGYVNFNFEEDNSVIREFNGLYYNKGLEMESFGYKIAKRYMPKKQWEANNIKDKLRSPRVINYKGDLHKFINFTIDEFMTLSNKSLLKDKIVLIGYLGTPTANINDVEDKHFTPLNTITSGKSIPDMYGVAIHANIISMIIENTFMYRISTFWIVVFTFLCSLIVSIYFIWLSKRLKISYRTVRKLMLLVFTILLVWLTLWLFKKGVVLKSAPIIFVTVFSAGFIKFYKHLIRYIKTKRKFKTYMK
ncbi:CHASE2 domain-containing sensor protein [Maribacter vaceletii]|uniref:CHASE2 domain-containing sensor protein n=1 Tax=Maribacter vaceletii TaxID=1206816 RepID=A0A495ECP3_9FLAO|nr:CHASE2 domain-containing sensor protein [Maribacter vaceletii]